jgi:hypothetical protein
MLEKIIKKIVRKESLNEALEILSLSDDVSVDKFMQYYNDTTDNNYLLCFLQLDSMKDVLVKNGKMEKGGDFGNLDELFN